MASQKVLDSCTHDDIDNGYCLYCGIYTGEEYTGGCYEELGIGGEKVKEVFDYKEFIVGLELPDQVRIHAYEQVDALLPRTHVRLGRHLQTVYTIVYIAYNAVGIPFNPRLLATKVGLEDKALRETVKLISEGIESEGFQIPVSIITPNYFYDEILKGFGVDIDDDKREKLEEFTRWVFENDKTMSNDNPETLAIIIIKCFLDYIGMSYREDFNEAFGKTRNYIKIQENIFIRKLNKINIETLQ